MLAKEINTYKRDDLFAATPPLEAMKILFSAAVTEGIGYTLGEEEQGFVPVFLDSIRAYYQARATREIDIDLPEEDGQEGLCGGLLKYLQGARDVVFNWEREYSNWLGDIGFVRGTGHACVYFYSAKRLRLVVHGDDFTALGPETEARWFADAFCKRFDAKNERANWTWEKPC